MARTLPRAAAVRAAADAEKFTPQSVPPLALAVRALPETDISASAAQLHECVELRVIPNPLVDAVLKRAGATRKGARSYRMKVPRSPHVVAAALSSIPRNAFALPETGLSGAVGPVLAALLSDKYEHAPARKYGLGPVVAGKHARGTVFLRLFSDELVIGGRALNLLPSSGRARPALLTPGEAYDIIGAAIAEGIPAVDIDTPGRLDELWEITEERLVVLPVLGRPGYARFDAAAGKSTPSTRDLPALDAVMAADRHLGARRVAIHPDIADVARVSSAAGEDREGLYSFQDLFVSSYVASRRGLVNALEPGLGKTVCASASMRDKSVRLCDAGDYAAMVVVPGLTLREQWRSELGKFFPEASVHIASDAATVAAIEPLRSAASGPLVVVTSTEQVSRFTDELACDWDDLIVDEGAFLRNPDSVRSQALWRVRDSVSSAMVLTGTPAETSGADLVKLVAFARNDRDLLRQQPGSDLDAARAAVGPLVFHRSRADVSDELPSGVLDLVTVAAAPQEVALGDALAGLLADLVEETKLPGRAGSSARVKVTSTLTASRLASTDPTTFAASKYADQVRSLADKAAAQSAKVSWVLGAFNGWVEAGQRVLVVSDFAGALVRLHLAALSSGVRSSLIGSSQTPAARAEAVAAFTEGDVDVLMTSLVGQVGLNLQAADVVVHLDVPVSPTAMTQRVARAIRLGSTKPEVRLVVPVIEGSVEERLAGVLGIKDGCPWNPAAVAEGPVRVAARVARR